MAEKSSHDPGSAPLSAIAEADEAFDQELGKRMGEAAQKLREGELTEAEFYDRFHEEVLAEFGFDDRPLDRGGD
ncbi:MAG: 4Fe-4S ferredoxin N-terminal domain-containing protein [Halodesulfurarchaeum sp.]